MRIPRIKAYHSPVRFPDGRIVIGSMQFGVGAELRDDPAGTTWRLLGLLDGSRTAQEIVDVLREDDEHLDPDVIRAAVDTLINAGYIEDAGAPTPDLLTADELHRYTPNREFFAWVDDRPRATPWSAQLRLKAAQVTIVGLGGTGSALAAGLAAAGVGSVRLVDFDRVEESNLTRQLIYSQDDVGSTKTAAAARSLARLNRHVKVEVVELQVASQADLARVGSDVDLLIVCAERMQTMASDVATHTGVPWLLCAYAGPMAVVGIFVPGITPCWRCLIETTPNAGAIERNAERRPVSAANPVIAPVANISGHIGALEAVYFLADLRPQTVGRVLHQNLMRYDHSYYIEPSFWPGCPNCRPDGSL
jgi:molybdopterin-synthase adenylyltransferase